MSVTEVSSRMPALLVQFAKWPQAGRVKTRLIPALGEAGALAAHVRLTGRVLDNLSRSGLPVQFWWDRKIDVPPQAALPILDQLEAAGIEQRFQAGEDLGERMWQCLSVGLEHYAKVIIVGSDCPSVDPAYLADAVQALEHHDVVLGPSDDGGYVLIGARMVCRGMLEGIAWGTDQVLLQTVERLGDRGVSQTQLEPRWDVDEPGDWQRFLLEMPGS